eukprot:CAMPEP_0171462352 /NCGR_PEP_ID=MMETSP0945-20130129/6423_1 /TAXON_ID=109269 /ORGANISM="Vaucheria litorea, Strain CCMP2940" /LENGTH=34 /DNA_ID= /DNA_START= /DNA_END= /DNA_ORIENTATION=
MAACSSLLVPSLSSMSEHSHQLSIDTLPEATTTG